MIEYKIERIRFLLTDILEIAAYSALIILLLSLCILMPLAIYLIFTLV